MPMSMSMSRSMSAGDGHERSRWTVVLGVTEGPPPAGEVLARSVALAADISGSRSRVVPLLSRRQYRLHASALEGMPPSHAVVQARWRGTALAVLLPLLRVAYTDPEAVVALLPVGGRWLEDEVEGFERAFEQVAGGDDLVHLPSGPGHRWRVRPLVGRVAALLSLFQAAVPEQLAAVLSLLDFEGRPGPWHVPETVERLVPLDFEAQVVARAGRSPRSLEAGVAA